MLSRNNNFDLIRLIAAAQVLVMHSALHFRVDIGWLATAASYVPGVPAFFFISGFLISASWEARTDWRGFYLNRIYRIFPALWTTLILSIATLFVFYDPTILAANVPGFLAWVTSQIIGIQYWNPGFLRGYGVGVVNGSLWTIPVELSFYLSVPLIYMAMRRTVHALPILIAASFGLLYAGHGSGAWTSKAIKLTALPWIGIFCLGVLAQRNFASIRPLVEGRFLLFLIGFIAISAASHFAPAFPLIGFGGGNYLGILNYMALFGLCLSLAYSYRGASRAVLAGNDFSYGLYILHMPVINVLVESGYFGPSAMCAAMAITAILAVLSWFLVEKPALSLKKSKSSGR